MTLLIHKLKERHLEAKIIRTEEGFKYTSHEDVGQYIDGHFGLDIAKLPHSSRRAGKIVQISFRYFGLRIQKKNWISMNILCPKVS